LGWVLGWDKETFRGRSAVVRERDRCPDKLLTGLIVEGRQPLRDGGEVVAEGVNVGTLTSGNYSPVLERGIGLGLLSGDLEPGTPVSVALRGREIAASVHVVALRSKGEVTWPIIFPTRPPKSTRC